MLRFYVYSVHTIPLRFDKKILTLKLFSKVFFLFFQQNQADERFVTFGRERYAPIPGETANGASAMQIQASFTWREIPRDRIILGKVLGEGEFGMVVKGELTEDDGHITQCAVKKLKRMFIELL